MRATADDHQRASELKNLGMLNASSLRKCYRNLSTEYFAAERKIVELETKLRQEREAREKIEQEGIALHYTAFAIARERILHMIGPLEVNEVLTDMDEACEVAEMSPNIVDSLQAQITQLQTTISQQATEIERLKEFEWMYKGLSK